MTQRKPLGLCKNSLFFLCLICLPVIFVSDALRIIIFLKNGKTRINHCVLMVPFGPNSPILTPMDIFEQNSKFVSRCRLLKVDITMGKIWSLERGSGFFLYSFPTSTSDCISSTASYLPPTHCLSRTLCSLQSWQESWGRWVGKEILLSPVSASYK